MRRLPSRIRARPLRDVVRQRSAVRVAQPELVAFDRIRGGLRKGRLDGEALTMDPPLVFSSRPGVLRLRLPKQAIGYSPAARATGVRGLLGVWTVVLGRPVAIGE